MRSTFVQHVFGQVGLEIEAHHCGAVGRQGREACEVPGQPLFRAVPWSCRRISGSRAPAFHPLEERDRIEVAPVVGAGDGRRKFLPRAPWRRSGPTIDANLPLARQRETVELRDPGMRQIAVVSRRTAVPSSPRSTTVTCSRAISEHPGGDRRGGVGERFVEVLDQPFEIDSQSGRTTNS